jgi:hypothetical protein
MSVLSQPNRALAIKVTTGMLLGLLVGFIVREVVKPIDPLYKGKPLSHWLKNEYWKADAGSDLKEAVRQIGTNGIPTLLHLLRSKDSFFRTGLQDVMRRQSLITVDDVSAELGNYAATWALGELGTNAQMAVSELIKIADENISPTSQKCAIESLGYVGESSGEAVAALVRYATNSNKMVRTYARFGLKQIAPEERPN